MPLSNSTMIHRLQNAINDNFGEKITYNKTQFYSESQNRPVTMYTIKKAVWDEQRNRNRHVELFKSTSQIQIVLYLRDMWYELNRWEVPQDNDMWNEIKSKNSKQV